MHQQGGFQLEFVSISRVINQMTCYKFMRSHWLRIYLKKNPLQDLLSGLNAAISTNESTRIITGHVIYNPAYTYLQILTENHPSVQNVAIYAKISENMQYITV